MALRAASKRDKRQVLNYDQGQVACVHAQPHWHNSSTITTISRSFFFAFLLHLYSTGSTFTINKSKVCKHRNVGETVNYKESGGLCSTSSSGLLCTFQHWWAAEGFPTLKGMWQDVLIGLINVSQTHQWLIVRLITPPLCLAPDFLPRICIV